jgi:hypothetical protein
MAKQSTNKRPRLGDLIEIPVANGFAYAQYVYEHQDPPCWGALIRVFTDICSVRPDDFASLVSGPERFVTFYPLRSAVSQKLVQIVGHFEVPERYNKLPLFKSPGGRDWSTGAVKIWWLWQGGDDWREEPLAVEHYDLPDKALVGHTPLIEYIETGWHPRDDVFDGRPDLKKAYEEWKQAGGVSSPSAAQVASVAPANVRPRNESNGLIESADDSSDGEEDEQAVLVEFRYSGEDLEPLYEVEDKLTEALEESGKGVCDGHEIATDLSGGTLYLYGPSADELYAAARPILAASKCLKQPHATLRYGPPGEDTPQKRIKVTKKPR